MIAAQTEYHTELIDGQEIQKCVPKSLHADVQYFVLMAFAEQFKNRSKWKARPELNLICGEDRLVPDVVIAAPDSKYRDGDLLSPAALAFEIMSPGQTVANLIDRADRIVKAGTPLCIVIWPERRRVWSYTKDDVAEQTGIVQTGDLTFDVAALWQSLDAEA